MKHDLELKVLAGVHAGAKARLHGDRVVIGASDDCDVVLAVDDVAAHHAALVIEGGEVFVEPLDGEVMRPDGASVSGRERLDAFAPLCLGATWIAVAEAGGSWPRIDPASLHPRRALSLAADTEAEVQGVEPQGVASAAASVRRRRLAFERVTLYPLAVLLLVGIGFIGSTWFMRGDAGAVAPSLPPPGQSPTAVEQADLLLADLGLENTLELRPIGERTLLVTGYVELSRQKTTLKERMTLPGVEFVHRVWAQEDLLRQARDRVAEAAPELKVETVKAGVVRLRGYLPDGDRRNRVVMALREDVPGIRDVVDEIVTRADAERLLRDALDESTLAGRVTLRPTPDGVAAEGVLGDADLAAWRQLLAQFRARYGTEVVVNTAFVPRPQDLPFGVRAAVAGPGGFVMTGDGRRVMRGGDLGGGYVLEAVGGDEITIRRGEQVFVQRFKE